MYRLNEHYISSFTVNHFFELINLLPFILGFFLMLSIHLYIKSMKKKNRTERINQMTNLMIVTVSVLYHFMWCSIHIITFCCFIICTYYISCCTSCSSYTHIWRLNRISGESRISLISWRRYQRHQKATVSALNCAAHYIVCNV